MQVRQFLKRWAESTSPGWVGPGFVCVVLIISAATALLPLSPRDQTSATVGAICLGALIVAWLVETAGASWNRWLFIVATAAPTTVLIGLGNWSLAPIFLLLLITWVAYTQRQWRSVTILGVALCCLLPLIWRDPIANWLPWAFGMMVSWLSSCLLGVQQRLLAQLRAAQADLARQSAAEERRRIAREVHDVIAHSLAITMLHLTGARHILQRDPQRAVDALTQAEQLGRQSLADIRRTVGLLGSAQDGGAMQPLPNATDIPHLVAEFRQAGLHVGYVQSGDAHQLPAATGLDLYRITQEALSNVAKHAPGTHAEVRLDVSCDRITLCVRDSGVRAGGHPLVSVVSSKMGLEGMRERARLHGGILTIERGEAGWFVECTLPLITSIAAGF